jgi:hypothetical protein
MVLLKRDFAVKNSTIQITVLKTKEGILIYLMMVVI